MTQKKNAEKKPLWVPIDEKEVEEGKKSYVEEIAEAKTRFKEYEGGRDLASDHNSPSMKAHFASMYIMQYHRVDTLETFLAFAETIFEMYQKVGVALQTLEKQVEEISKHTNTDLSKIKSDMAKVQETVNAPIYSFIREKKEAEQKIQTKGEAFFDQYTRSH